jgi:hypothetical protein
MALGVRHRTTGRPFGQPAVKCGVADTAFRKGEVAEGARGGEESPLLRRWALDE